MAPSDWRKRMTAAVWRTCCVAWRWEDVDAVLLAAALPPCSDAKITTCGVQAVFHYERNLFQPF